MQQTVNNNKLHDSTAADIVKSHFVIKLHCASSKCDFMPDLLITFKKPLSSYSTRTILTNNTKENQPNNNLQTIALHYAKNPSVSPKCFVSAVMSSTNRSIPSESWSGTVATPTNKQPSYPAKLYLYCTTSLHLPTNLLPKLSHILATLKHILCAYQSINQTIRQSINQSINQSIKYATTTLSQDALHLPSEANSSRG